MIEHWLAKHVLGITHKDLIGSLPTPGRIGAGHVMRSLCREAQSRHLSIDRQVAADLVLCFAHVSPPLQLRGMQVVCHEAGMASTQLVKVSPNPTKYLHVMKHILGLQQRRNTLLDGREVLGSSRSSSIFRVGRIEHLHACGHSMRIELARAASL
jgi:hypothetical protein